MNRVAISALAIILSGCGSQGPSELSDAERAKIALGGIHIGMTKDQAIAAEKATLSPNPNIELSVSVDPVSNTISFIRERRLFPNGTDRARLIEVLSNQLGTLRAPPSIITTDGNTAAHELKPHGIFYVGEGVTPSGDVVKRCLSTAANFDFASPAPPECGLMAQITFDDEAPYSDSLVRQAIVEIHDFRYDEKLKALANSQADKKTQQDEQNTIARSEQVNSF